jgi:hypothetical protein
MAARTVQDPAPERGSNESGGGWVAAMTSRLVSRLRWVADGLTGAPVDTARERGECILDEEGHTVRWRVWVSGPDGGWLAQEWREPTAPVKRPAARPTTGAS